MFLAGFLSVALPIQSYQLNPSPPLEAVGWGYKCAGEQQIPVSWCPPEISTGLRLDGAEGLGHLLLKYLHLPLQPSPVRHTPSSWEPSGYGAMWIPRPSGSFLRVLSICSWAPGLTMCSSAFVYWMWAGGARGQGPGTWVVKGSKRSEDLEGGLTDWRKRPFSTGENLHFCIIVKLSVPSLDEHL